MSRSRAPRAARTPEAPDDRLGQPYPLRRRFVRWILPGLAAFVAVAGALSWIGGRALAEGVYLEHATRQAEIIDRAMAKAAPDAWHRLKQGAAPAAFYEEAEGRRLLAELTREVQELDLASLKIYGAGGLILYATDARRIGTTDRSAAFVAAEGGTPSVVHRIDRDGSALYELYVQVASPGGESVVFELYEPVTHLNALLWRAGWAAAGVPGLILAGLTLAMGRLVVLAQRDIDARAALVAELRRRLERLVSGAASTAVHRAVSAGSAIPSIRTRCTLLYADIRDFSSFAETSRPEEVVQLLNRLLAIVVGEIDRAGGDVDKLIGDAVLARFQGERSEARAVAAARQALAGLARADLPRGIGIGLYTGEVIAGTIGSADRMDFTVIGDSVNIAARLCSIAARGEIVADADTAAASGEEGFAPPETIAVKGRSGRLSVRRYRIR